MSPPLAVVAVPLEVGPAVVRPVLDESVVAELLDKGAVESLFVVDGELVFDVDVPRDDGVASISSSE